MKVDVVLFDLGGVVCRFLPERRLSALARACGVPPETVDEVLFVSGFDHLCDLGKVPVEEILDRTRAGLGFPGGLRELQELWCLAFDPDPAVLALAERVRPRRTGLFTDNGPLLLDAMPWAFPEVAERFDELIFSCVIGETKPRPHAFTRALEMLDAHPERTLFIDDSSRNVEAARELGITAVRFEDARRLEADLAGLL